MEQMNNGDNMNIDESPPRKTRKRSRNNRPAGIHFSDINNVRTYAPNGPGLKPYPKQRSTRGPAKLNKHNPNQPGNVSHLIAAAHASKDTLDDQIQYVINQWRKFPKATIEQAIGRLILNERSQR